MVPTLFEEIGEPSQEQMNSKTQEVSEAFCINCHNYKEEIDKLLKQKTEQQISINKLEELINKMQTNVNNLHENNDIDTDTDTEITISKMLSYENISQNKEMIKSTTGLEADDFQAVCEFLDTGPHCENIKFYDGQNNKKPKSYPQNVKPRKKAKLLIVDQFFMYLSWSRNGFTTRMLSWLFDIPKSTVSRYLVTRTNLLYFSLGKMAIWPSKVQVLDAMPETFQTTYPSTRCIIDCTEIFCQRPSSTSSQSAMYSNYKHRVTYKGLLVIAPLEQLHS